MRFRCDWCGKFYSSPLPEGSACVNHIPEHNERLSASIARHNKRLAFNRAHGLRPDDEWAASQVTIQKEPR